MKINTRIYLISIIAILASISLISAESTLRKSKHKHYYSSYSSYSYPYSSPYSSPYSYSYTRPSLYYSPSYLPVTRTVIGVPNYYPTVYSNYIRYYPSLSTLGSTSSRIECKSVCSDFYNNTQDKSAVCPVGNRNLNYKDDGHLNCVCGKGKDNVKVMKNYCVVSQTECVLDNDCTKYVSSLKKAFRKKRSKE
jgi:hypothetical protein